MKIKHILPLSAATAVLLCNVAYAGDVKVTIDGEQVVFADVEPIIENSRTYVPLRGLFEKLGYEISWDENLKTATLSKDNIEITANTNDLRISKDGSKRAIGNGNFPILRDGRFLLPVRAISEASGCTVTWDAETKTVVLFTEDTEKSDYKDPNGRGTANEEDYIRSAYDLCKEIKNISSKSDDPSLLRFMEQGHLNDKTVIPSTGNNERLKEIADKIYSLEPASGMTALQPYYKNYADNICKFIEITESFANEEITSEQATEQIDLLREEKEELAINFSVALNDYFKAKNVFYEGVYDEYVLDMLK